MHVVDEVDVPAAGCGLRMLDGVEERHSPLNPRAWLSRIQVGPVAREPRCLLLGDVAQLPPDRGHVDGTRHAVVADHRGVVRLATRAHPRSVNKAPPVENFAWLPVGYKANKTGRGSVSLI